MIEEQQSSCSANVSIQVKSKFSMVLLSSFAVNKNGGFLVRDSKHGGTDSPFTLTVFNENRIFNINIRLRRDGSVALGKEKPDENVYSSVVEMVERHGKEELKLTSAD